MNWEKITSPDFEDAVKTCRGVCLLPIGVIEKHGDHLPLGQDTLFAHALCSQAAEQEPAMVFPLYYFGQINEARHQPGTIAVNYELLLPLLENVCDEISRNGFKKILIVNGHGGNRDFLSFFLRILLEKDKDYIAFLAPVLGSERDKLILESKFDEKHGGERETSLALSFFPELVKSETPAGYGKPLDRLVDYKRINLKTSIGWYANYPGHLSADGTPGSSEKGKILAERRVKKLAQIIRLIKKDDTPMKLYKQFREQARNPRLSP